MSKTLQAEVPKGEGGSSRGNETQSARNGAPSDKKKRNNKFFSLSTLIDDEDTYQLREVSYEDCISYFIDNEPPKFSRAAILVQKRGVAIFSSRYKITQIYLDASDEVVRDASGRICGRVVLADSLDSELKDAFGKHKILIVE